MIDLATVPTRDLLDEVERRCKDRPCYPRRAPPLEEPINMYDAIVTKDEPRHGRFGWLF